MEDSSSETLCANGFKSDVTEDQSSEWQQTQPYNEGGDVGRAYEEANQSIVQQVGVLRYRLRLGCSVEVLGAKGCFGCLIGQYAFVWT